jgi:hypothetical protein
MAIGRVGLRGELGLRVVRGVVRAPLGWRVRNALRWGYVWGLISTVLAQGFSRLTGLPVMTSALRLVKVGADGRRVDYGVVGRRVVTTVGVGFIVDAFQNSVELETMKYHGIGVGTGNEDVGDSALGSELTTEYSSNSTRATGTTAEGASANIYQSVATNTVDAGVAITEHGIFSDVDTGEGVLLDRTKFAAVNLASGDSLQSTYSLTFTAGS